MQRNLTLDGMKVMLAFMVVGIHAGFLNEISNIGNILTTQGIFRIAVPIFFIINGYYFSASNRGELLKWCSRLLSLYAFWLLIYSYSWLKLGDVNLKNIALLIKEVLFGYHHLWYLSATFGGGICVYFLRYNRKVLYIFAGVAYLVGVAIQYVGNYHLFEGTLLDKVFNYSFVHRNFLFLGLPFFSVGVAIKQYSIDSYFSKTFLLSTVFLGLLLLGIESYWNYLNDSSGGGYDNYLTLIIICPSLFVLALRSTSTTSIKVLTSLSTSIYLIHPIWIDALNQFFKFGSVQVTVIVILLSSLSAMVLIRAQKKWKFVL